MNKKNLFESITNELDSQKNKFKYTGGEHNLTNGEWKESILMSLMAQHLPSNVGISSGFIVSEDNCSSQIDILFYDKHKPILFNNGHVVNVTPDCVRGIVEVKTHINGIVEFNASVRKIAENIRFVRQNGNFDYLFTGLFSYETTTIANLDNMNLFLKGLFDNAEVKGGIISEINHVSIGKDIFIKYWNENPHGGNRVYNTWHGYELKDMAQAYFMMNAVIEVSDNSHEINSRFWFPPQGKEENVIAKLTLLKDSKL